MFVYDISLYTNVLHLFNKVNISAVYRWIMPFGVHV